MNLFVPMLKALDEDGYGIAIGNLSNPFLPHMRTLLSHADVVLVDVTVGRHEMIDFVQKLRTARCLSGAAPRILCFSTTRRNPRFVLELGKCGVRYARISDPAMLIESMEILLAEETDFELTGPRFCIAHRFSQGTCAPGEEVAAIELHSGGFFQLPLSLSQRLVFNLLAESRGIALDSFQIVARLNGWFYRDHGLNSGVRQSVKVRVATIKVLVQRIRQAMASTFVKADLKCDPDSVLRSFPAEGSKRALYLLHADIRWDHRPN
jgi:hypothetical protein